MSNVLQYLIIAAIVILIGTIIGRGYMRLAERKFNYYMGATCEKVIYEDGIFIYRPGEKGAKE